MNLPPLADQALAEFAACPGWEQRARLLLYWGERLQPLSEAQYCADNQVHGCESRVWLTLEHGPAGLQFRAASDARLLRGLLALLLARVNGLTGPELLALDLADWFVQLGLSRQLSPSRSNGLNAVLLRMRELAGA